MILFERLSDPLFYFIFDYLGSLLYAEDLFLARSLVTMERFITRLNGVEAKDQALD